MIDRAFALLSFCPSSGIGLYVVGDVLRGFDLVAEEDHEIARSGDEIAAGATRFASHLELVGFATREFLRDKKHTYYSTLLTEDVDPALRDDIVRFLDAEELAPLTMTREVVTTLREIGNPSRAWRCLRRAQHLNCERVVTSLRTNFSVLLGPPNIIPSWPPPPVEQRPPAALTRRVRPHPEPPRWVPFEVTTEAHNPDTERYVAALIAGDQRVQEHFFVEIGRRMQRRIPSRLWFMAEDLVLTALLRTLESVRKSGLREPWHLQAYAFRVLRNCIADEYRQEQRYVPFGEHLLAPVDPSVDAMLWRASPPPPRSTVPPEVDVILAEALQRLQEREPRAAAVLHLRMQGDTFAEIATGLRITRSAASHLYDLGIRWLRTYFVKDKGPS